MSQDLDDLLVRQEARERWARACAAYDADPRDFYAAWCYLFEHPIFQDLEQGSLFERELYIHPAKVNPTTREVDDDEAKNTHLEIWVEHGPVWRKDDAPAGFWDEDLTRHSSWDYVHTHDPDLDTAGDTFEGAIIALARLVRHEYGDDRSRVYLSDRERHPERDEEDKDE